MTHGKFLRGMAAGALVAVVAFFGLGGYAQISNPGGGVTMSDVLSVVPQPATTVPQTEAVGGAVGAATTQFMRADAQIPRITRAATVTTDAAGAWSVTWTSPLMAVPNVLPVPINPGAQPVVCQVVTRSATGATGTCQMARTLPSTLTLLTALINYAVFQLPPVGTQVQVLAIPPTQ